MLYDTITRKLKSAEEFTKEVVGDLIAEVKELNFNDDAKQDVLEKLNTIQYIIGYPEEILNLRKIEEFYGELELNGTEGIVETYLTIIKYTQMIQNNPKSNWKRKLIELALRYNIKYYTDENKLCEYQ